MDPILVALLGGVGGSFVTLFAQIWLELLKQRHEFQKTRLVALQDCVLLIDSLFAYGEVPDSTIDEELWKHARKHNSWNGIFFPDHLQGDFTHLVRTIIREQDPRRAFEANSREALQALRSECLQLVKSHRQTRWRSFCRLLGFGD